MIRELVYCRCRVHHASNRDYEISNTIQSKIVCYPFDNIYPNFFSSQIGSDLQELWRKKDNQSSGGKKHMSINIFHHQRTVGACNCLTVLCKAPPFNRNPVKLGMRRCIYSVCTHNICQCLHQVMSY